MRKVFINVPIKGMTHELIADEVKRAMAYLELVCPNEDFEYMTNEVHIVPDVDDCNFELYCLGDSIEKMSRCEILVIPSAYEVDAIFPDCRILNDIAHKYGMYVVNIPLDLLPEARDMEKRSYCGEAAISCNY